MGGFDSCAFQIRVDLGLVRLDRSTLDRLELALERAVPQLSGSQSKRAEKTGEATA